jgi:hypothetical protein
MKVMHEYGSGIARLSGLESLHGTTVVYIVKGAEVDCYECDYEIRLMVETNKSELRAVRQQKLESGAGPGFLPQACLQGELGVIFGPEITPNSAAEFFETLARKIRQRGLVTGHDERGRLGLEGVRKR